MKTVPEQLSDFLRGVSPSQYSSGELQRMSWKNKNGTSAVPRSIVRRLEELVEDGTLKVEIKDRHAWYSFGDKKRGVSEFVPVEVNGVRMMREVISYV